ncbi:MAG: ankyrin repeat domain-containing protein [Bryobacteraceae bacterium]
MGGIFISYRRDDTAGYAGRLYDQLSAHFGEERVFMDVSAIEPGEDFAKTIDTKLHTCDAALVLIGRNWLNKRLNDPADFVSLEIRSALERGIPVIPVLVDDTHMPAAAELPPPLAPLCRRQAVELTNSMFRDDVNRLIQTLDRACHEHGGAPEQRSTASVRPKPYKFISKRMRFAGVGALLVATAGLAYLLLYRGMHRGKAPTPDSTSRSSVGAVTPSQQPPSSLITAIQEGRLADAKSLIAKGANVNAALADGTTALMQAAEGSSYMPNNGAAVKMLLDDGAEADAQDNRGRTALYRAVAEGKIDAMRLLLSHRANPNQKAADGSTPLLTAVLYGRPDAVSLLLASGSEVNMADAQGTTPLALAAEGTSYMPNNGPLVRALLERGADVDAQDARGRTPLHRAAAEGKNEAVQLLLESKANPNARTHTGATPLLEAVTYGHQSIVQLLLQRGADPNLADAEGNTPLMIAAEGTAYFPNNRPMAATLIEARATVDAQDSRGRSALYRAAVGGKVAAMALLLDNAAYTNLQANDGSTPLLQAVTYGHLNAATLLLNRGANVDLPDASGNTPLMVVAEGTPYIRSTADFMTLLLGHKAQPALLDNRGRSAVTRATEGKNSAAVELLKNK